MKNLNKFTKVATAFLICFCCVFSNSPNVFAAENADNAKYVYLGGEAFGIKMFTKGAVIIRLEDFNNGMQSVCPAKSAGLKVNDNIVKVNDIKITDNEQLEEIIENSDGECLKFQVERNSSIIDINITPQKNETGIYKIGAWIRDSCAGIGTVSYYDEENGVYGALGHGICDIDTEALLPLDSGSVVCASINSVVKGENGNTGTLNGYLSDNKIGNLLLNTELGIYGQYEKIDNNKEKIEVSPIDEVKTGKASIYTTIDNSGAKEYEAEILNFGDKSCNTNKNFVIKITDKRLLDVTGGIVQGMSGSPVVQNGKLAGVINHVFVNDPEKGYCEFAQNMVSNFEVSHKILYENVN